jgi:hypothetical protein
MNHHGIFEKRLPVNHFLVRSIFGDASIAPTSKAFGHVVYFDEINPRVITAKLVYLQNEEDQPPEFVNLLDQDLNFNECLAISTLYFLQPFSLIRKILNERIEPIDDVLEHILKPTNGFMIYCHQFEQLAQLALNVPLDEAVRLRKVYNKQRSFGSVGNRDDDALCLFKNIVQRHCIQRNVHIPNYRGALNLRHYARTVA